MSFCKKPCKHCPYRNDVKPYLHPERGEELAYIVQSPYNTFFCHKTTEVDEESEEGRMMATNESLLCAGFLTLQAQELGEDVMPEGFEPSYDIVYTNSWEMRDAYEQE